MSSSQRDARKLHRTLGRLNKTQRTLYAVNALCGEISNGGISQFFFNTRPFLRNAAATALERIGATDMLREYMKILERIEGDDDLAAIRATAEVWSDYMAFKNGLESGHSDPAAFDDWFFDGQEEVLDRLMRAFISNREDDLVRFCDGDTRLEARWSGKRLGRLVDDYDRYQSAYEEGRPYQFFDHLFTPNCRERFGDFREERKENARIVAAKLMSLIRKAARKPSIASFVTQPSPGISICGLSGFRSGGHVIVSFYENNFDLQWLISAWE